jgi:hypothetical protein
MMTIKEAFEKLNNKFTDFYFVCEETHRYKNHPLANEPLGHTCNITYQEKQSNGSGRTISVTGDNCVEDAYYLLADRLHT